MKFGEIGKCLLFVLCRYLMSCNKLYQELGSHTDFPLKNDRKAFRPLILEYISNWRSKIEFDVVSQYSNSPKTRASPC